MRFRARSTTAAASNDLTPMIDMTFQLIAFFMFVLNFSEVDQDERIQLPASELAKPPETAPELPLTIQVTQDGTAVFAGQSLSLAELRIRLRKEAAILDYLKKSPTQATMIIRADAATATGRVQQVIEVCQSSRFEKFALRAKQEE